MFEIGQVVHLAKYHDGMQAGAEGRILSVDETLEIIYCEMKEPTNACHDIDGMLESPRGFCIPFDYAEIVPGLVRMISYTINTRVVDGKHYTQNGKVKEYPILVNKTAQIGDLVAIPNVSNNHVGCLTEIEGHRAIVTLFALGDFNVHQDYNANISDCVTLDKNDALLKWIIVNINSQIEEKIRMARRRDNGHKFDSKLKSFEKFIDEFYPEFSSELVRISCQCGNCEANRAFIEEMNNSSISNDGRRRRSRGNYDWIKCDGKIYSKECFEVTHYSCDRCGEPFSRKAGDLEPLCPSCRRREYVLPYHSHIPPIKFFGDSKDNAQPFLGVELEVDEAGESDNEAKKVVRLLNTKDIFAYCSHDSSINNGFEIVTQPATFEYHSSIKDIYAKTFQVLKQDGYLSHDTTTCGMHVHFNRNFFPEADEELCITRLLYLVDRFWDEFIIFARRNYRRMERYAKKIEKSQISRHAKEYNKSCSHEQRYYAINVTNINTIEFRMFRGTLNVDTFMATIQFVRNCVVAAREKSADEIQSMKFDELITGKVLKRYWARRSAVDGTEE